VAFTGTAVLTAAIGAQHWTCTGAVKKITLVFKGLQGLFVPVYMMALILNVAIKPQSMGFKRCFNSGDRALCGSGGINVINP
jgi:hypothetical protein